MKKLIIILIIISTNLFSQEYEIAWEKDIGGSFAQFSKDGEFIYVAQGLEIWKYRSSDGEYISKFDTLGANFKSDKIYNGIIISGNGNFIVARIDAGDCVMFDTKTEKVFKSLNFGGSSDISPDENYIYTARYDGTYLTKFDIMQNKQIIQRKIINEVFSKAKLSHNGKIFATASIGASKYYLTLWDTETLTEIKRFELKDSLGYTEFKDIKFSWDDNLIGIRSYFPYIARIFNINNYNLVINSWDVKNIDNYGFDFTMNNKLCLYFLGSQFYIIDSNLKNVIQYENIKASPLTTSQNNLIFTGDRLLRPKTVGVTENEQKRLLISPNPSSDYIEINVGAGSKPALENPGIEIYNIFGEKNPTLALPIGEGTGKVLPNGEDLGGVFKIDVSNLAPGVYFIKIGDKFEKFVKM